MPEKRTDFLPDLCRIHLDRTVNPRGDNQAIAHIGSYLVIVGKPDLLRKGKYTFPAEYTFSQIDGTINLVVPLMVPLMVPLFAPLLIRLVVPLLVPLLVRL